MPKRTPPDEVPATQKAKFRSSSGGPGAVSLLLFWPFHLFHYLTRHLGFPLRPLARIVGHPCVAGLYGLLILSVIYGIRSGQFDLRKIDVMPERTIVLDRNGEELGRIHGEKRDVIPLS